MFARLISVKEGSGGGGSVNLDANITGSITIDTHGNNGNSFGSRLGDGGNITLIGAFVNISAISANAGSLGIDNCGRRGGNILINTMSGTINGNINTHGSNQVSMVGCPDNLNGGSITIKNASVGCNGGSVQIDSYGGNMDDPSSINSGTGGSVSISSPCLKLSTLQVFGGNGNTGAEGGNAGNINLVVTNSSNNLTLNTAMNANGGSGYQYGGNSSNINLTSENSINIVGSPFNLDLRVGGGGLADGDKSKVIINYTNVLNDSGSMSNYGATFKLKVIKNGFAIVDFGNNLVDWTKLGTNIPLGNNSAGVNSSVSALNKSANVTLYGLQTGLSNYRILRNSLTVCNSTTSPSCINQTALNLSTVVFSVSSWTNYSIMGDSDTTYPTFSNYSDNNGTIYNSGIGLFNVTVLNTNGTVILTFNNTNYTATNLTANVYNVSVALTTSGVYNYSWSSYGNGSLNLYNSSTTRYYTVLADNIAPNASLVSPSNGSTYTSVNSYLNFSINATDDVNLGNATFYLYNTTGIVNSSSISASGSQANLSVILTFPYPGQFFWNALVYDAAGNSAYATDNFTITYQREVTGTGSQFVYPGEPNYSYNMTALCTATYDFYRLHTFKGFLEYNYNDLLSLKSQADIQLGTAISSEALAAFLKNYTTYCNIPKEQILDEFCDLSYNESIWGWYIPFFKISEGQHMCAQLKSKLAFFAYGKDGSNYYLIGIRLWWVLLIIIAVFLLLGFRMYSKTMRFLSKKMPS